MFHQFPPTKNRRHLIDKNFHLLATRFYRRDSVMSEINNSSYHLQVKTADICRSSILSSNFIHAKSWLKVAL